MTFARTKIQAPRPRAALIQRQSLVSRLAESMVSRRVSLLCAPAGYGKTSLLAHALARLPQGTAVAWFSADEGDDLPGALECLLEALEPFDPPWRHAPQTLPTRAAASESELREVAAELINTLESCDVSHGVIVMDDLHRIEDPALFRFLDALAERLGSGWCLALASRVDPPLSLARLRAAGELAEFRQLQLRFDQVESRRLAQQAGLDQLYADRAFERTQGWPAGMGMAFASKLGAPQAPNLREGERSFFEYLLSEVLDRQRPELAAFLLDVSVLHELDPNRCTVVSGYPNSGSMLEEIERLGLLTVSLDGPSPALRLHDLLREALQQRLALRDPARLRNLRRRAAAGESDALRRIALLIAAEDHEEAARLVLAEVPERLARSGPSSVLHLLGSFPASIRDQSPELLLVRGLVGWVSWDFPMMLGLFERARTGFEQTGNGGGASLAAAYGAHGFIMAGRLQEASLVLASLEGRALPLETRALALNAAYWLAIDEGRTRDVCSLHAEQLDLLRRSSSVALAYQTSPPLRLPGLPGVLNSLEQHGDWLLHIAGDEPTALRPLGILSHAWVATWRGQLAEAHRLREQAREEAAWSGGSGAVMAHLLTHAAFSYAMSGQKTAAMAAARERADRQQHTGTWPSFLLAVLKGRISAACEDADALHRALDEARAVAVRLRGAGTPVNEWLLEPLSGQLAWLNSRRIDAIAHWRRALAHEISLDIYGQAAELRVRLAHALLQEGQVQPAAEVLIPALAIARAEQAPGGALLAPNALRALASAGWGPLLPEADLRLLRGWSSLMELETPAESTTSTLSPRELEVLARIAAGDSNKEIARAFDLSPHTVKRHVANLLDKLGVTTRGQAAARYTTLSR